MVLLAVFTRILRFAGNSEVLDNQSRAAMRTASAGVGGRLKTLLPAKFLLENRWGYVMLSSSKRSRIDRLGGLLA
jgi:hypothetical protein